MKYSTLVMLLGAAEAVRLGDNNLSQTAVKKYAAMDDKQLQGLVDAAVNAKALPDPKASKELSDADYKAVEAALAGRIVDRLKSGGYWGPYSYPLGGYYDAVGRLRHYHDMVTSWEIANGLPYWHDGSWNNDLGSILDAYAKAVNGAAPAKNATAPATKALLQTETEGVPVFVQPTLMDNVMGRTDLSQRDYTIDGVNGFDFVQTESQGVPVFVNPTLMQNVMGGHDLSQRDYTIDGVNGFDFVQVPDDVTVLQVHGEPVAIRSQTLPDDGPTEITNGGDKVHGLEGKADLGEKSIVGGTKVNYASHAQGDDNMRPITVNGTHGLTGMEGREDLG